MVWFITLIDVTFDSLLTLIFITILCYIYMQILILANCAYGKRMKKICHVIDIPADIFEFSEDGIVDVSKVVRVWKCL